MKVQAFTGGLNLPSSRFRIRQNIIPLSHENIELLESRPPITQHVGLSGRFGKVRGRYVLPIAAAQLALNTLLRVPGLISNQRADVSWIQRSFIPGFEWPVHLLRKPLVLDMDDAIWMAGFAGRNVPFLLRNADSATVGNEYLANWAAQYCRNIHIVPTGIDTQKFKPMDLPNERAEGFNIGWTGTSGNFQYLKLIEATLAEFLKRHRHAKLIVVADRAPALPLLPSDQVIYIPWTADSEASIINNFDCGIMPLADTEWAKGKCSFKLIQYMASGIPVIAAPVGMNTKVVTEGASGFLASTHREWLDALEVLSSDRDLSIKMGRAGRQSILEKYDTKVIAKQLARVFTQLM